MESPQYIKALLKSNGSKPQGRRVWTIDLEAVWLPFFLATNTMGDTALSAEALGAPLRLAYDPDGTPKFSKTGGPIVDHDKAALIAAMEQADEAQAQAQAEQGKGKEAVAA